MNRRTLIRGAAGASALSLMANRSLARVRAQASWYQVDVIYEFSEFAGEEYDIFNDGRASSVSGAGVIAGVDRIDGMRVPVTWNLFGDRQAVSTGAIDYADALTLLISRNGSMVANLGAGESLQDPTFSAHWQGAEPVLLPGPGLGETRITARSISDSSVIGGMVDGAPARWVDGALEILEAASVGTSTSVVALSPDGDGYGVNWNDEQTVPTIWRWGAAGDVTLLPLPDELMAETVLEINVSTVVGAFDHKSVVADFWWDEGTGNVTGSWIFQDGVWSRARGTTIGLAMSSNFAMNPDLLYGTFVENSQSQGDGILDSGNELLLANMATIPDGYSANRFIGVADDGTIVMTGSNIMTEGYPPVIFALRPQN